MILGRIVGKVSTKNFNFRIENRAEKFEYIQVMHEGKYVLGQIIEIEKDIEKAIAICNIIGYRNNNILTGLKTPFEPGIEVLRAEENFIRETLGLEKSRNGAYIGKLSYYNIDVYLDIDKLLNKHICVLAKSGSGKSYCSSVIIEELLEKNIPVLILDPHGEYGSLKYPSNKTEKLNEFNLKPKGYLKQIQEYSTDIGINTECKPLKLSSVNLSAGELLHLLPAKLNNQQKGILYAALKNLDTIDFDSLIYFLESQDSNVKYTLISIIEYIKKLGIFSEEFTSLNELIIPGKCTIINLKGVEQEIQEVVVYKLAKDLFNERKKGNIPPFFLVIEESHNFVPERSFSEAKSSRVLRQIFSEGRKFGLGCCLISQRASRVDKSALSQVTTQIILKITNPNDIKAVSNSVEGINLETEKEIRNIPIGTALVTGVVDLPLFVNIRPRRSKHGGESISLLESVKELSSGLFFEKENFGKENGKNDEKTSEKKTEKMIEKILEEKENLQRSDETKVRKENGLETNAEILALIKQKNSIQDLKLMDEDIKDIKVVLIPCAYLTCKSEHEFYLLVNLSNSEIITDFENGKGAKLEFSLQQLSPTQNKVFRTALGLKQFSAAELFSKSGVQFSEIYDIINILVNKGFFTRNGSNFMLNEKFNFDYKKLSCYERVEYGRVNYDLKIDKKISADDARKLLMNFFNVINLRECFLVVYDIKK